MMLLEAATLRRMIKRNHHLMTFLKSRSSAVFHHLLLLWLLAHRGTATIRRRTTSQTATRRAAAFSFLPAASAGRRCHNNKCITKATTWLPLPPTRIRYGASLRHQATTADSTPSSDSTKNVSDMRVSEIQAILKEWKVDYADCFDKESLVQRYREASAAGGGAGTKGIVPPQKSSANQSTTTTAAAAAASSTSSTVPTDSEYGSAPATKNAHLNDDEDDLLLTSLGKMTVKKLRQEMARCNLRWAGLLEKQDLVRALFEARKRARQFSVTGLVTPGQVANLNETQIQVELGAVAPSSLTGNKSIMVSTPLLVDVYATWCGPCQLLQGQLQEVAAQLQDRIRIVKMDSDQNPNLASRWRVQGLPTLILFDSTGHEIDRIEGALMKDQLIQWIETKI